MPEFDEISNSEGLMQTPALPPQERSSVPRVEREGLPPTYRMRADRHYVDQLISRSADAPIRMISIEQIDDAKTEAAGELEPLVQSIGALGVLQPLVVLSQGNRYSVIGGRNRLAAAKIAGLTEVPCVVYHGEGERSASLAAAIALRVTPAEKKRLSSASGLTTVGDLAHHFSREVAALCSASKLLDQPTLVAGPSISADLIRAQAWRLSWLANAVTLLSNEQPSYSRTRPLAVIVDRVLDGFEPETRLTRAETTCRIGDDVAGVAIDETIATTVIAAAMLLMLATLESVERPSIRLELTAGETGGLVIDIEQTIGAANVSYLREILTESTESLLLRTAVRCMTAWYQGKVELRANDGRTALRVSLRTRG